MELTPSNELYQSLLARDAHYDGLLFVAVTTTRIFCRLSCPAVKPRFDHCRFFTTVNECERHGFRPCQRCRPLDVAPTSPVVQKLLAALSSNPDVRWSEARLRKRGYDPSTVRRHFKRELGISFLRLARTTRVQRAAQKLEEGSDSMTTQLSAGYESMSGFASAIDRICPGLFDGQHTMGSLYADQITTPIGPMLSLVDGERCVLLEFLERRALARELQRIAKNASIVLQRDSLHARLQHEMDEYFSGTRTQFSLPTHQPGTARQRAVWSALSSIEYGATSAYSAIARDLGFTNGARSVAQASGANQLAILVPCHRVIAANGDLAGYGGKLWRKKWLLEHEAQNTCGTDS